jgi:hypothetical protein
MIISDASIDMVNIGFDREVVIRLALVIADLVILAAFQLRTESVMTSVVRIRCWRAVFKEISQRILSGL